MKKNMLALSLFLLLVLLLFPASAATVEMEPLPLPISSPSVVSPVLNVEPDADTMPLEDVSTGPTDLELLASIDTWLTYLFMFGSFYICVSIGKLCYSFFSMFF